MVQMIQGIQMVEEPSVIKNPLFLKFAEYLGYETPLIKWVDIVCEGKEVPNFIKNFLDIDAVMIFKQMKEEYTIDEIRAWWDKFYPVVIAEAEFKMITSSSDLPY